MSLRRGESQEAVKRGGLAGGAHTSQGFGSTEEPGRGEPDPYGAAHFPPGSFSGRLSSYLISRVLSLDLNCLILGLVTGNVSTELWLCNYCD